MIPWNRKMINIWLTLAFVSLQSQWVSCYFMSFCKVLSGSTDNLSFVILTVPHVMCEISISFLPCASQPSLNLKSLCFYLIKGTAPNLVLDKIYNIYFLVILFAELIWSFEFAIWESQFDNKRCRYCFFFGSHFKINILITLEPYI